MRVKEVLEKPEYFVLDQTSISRNSRLLCGLSKPIYQAKTKSDPELLSPQQQDRAINLAKRFKRQKLLARIQQSQRFKAANDTTKADVEQAWLDATFYQPRNSTL